MKMRTLTREENEQISSALRKLDPKMLKLTVEDYPHEGINTSPADLVKEIAACGLSGLAILELKNTERKSPNVFEALKNLKRIGCDPEVVNTFLVRLAVNAKSENEISQECVRGAVTTATRSKTPEEFMEKASVSKNTPDPSEMKVQRDPTL